MYALGKCYIRNYVVTFIRKMKGEQFSNQYQFGDLQVWVPPDYDGTGSRIGSFLISSQVSYCSSWVYLRLNLNKVIVNRR